MNNLFKNSRANIRFNFHGEVAKILFATFRIGFLPFYLNWKNKLARNQCIIGVNYMLAPFHA